MEETIKSLGLPISMRFRNLKERLRLTKDLVVLPSVIHGRGLFAQRDIGLGEMLIEYAGELIRSVLCDVRERKYEQKGIGCYMFRVNRDLVVDATMKGNAARFINHSCDVSKQLNYNPIKLVDQLIYKCLYFFYSPIVNQKRLKSWEKIIF
jgi:histone-lysine N-methyltransferase MLL1